jgi:predicted O-linked N-acetylglucosamine transferase (SPINDLY family)
VLTNNAENVPSGDLTQEAIHKGATDNTKPLTKNSIRVGFVSSHLRQHSICKLYCGIITRLKSATSRMFGSNNSVEVFVFSTSKQSREDSTTMHSVLRYAELITTVNLNNATTVQNTFAPAKTGFAIKEFIRVDASIVSNRPLVLSRDIDVLIFLDVGMVPTTNLWAAARLAPVQASSSIFIISET